MNQAANIAPSVITNKKKTGRNEAMVTVEIASQVVREARTRGT